MAKETEKRRPIQYHQKQWSITIKRHRLNWLGNILRLHEDTPARKSFAEAMRKTRKPVGRHLATSYQLSPASEHYFGLQQP